MIGTALDARTLARFEKSFQADLSAVRVYTCHAANALARAARADAFTIGESIFFATGCYAPHSVMGRRLLAHELTHVLQQRRRRSVSQSNALCEMEAVEAGAAVALGARWQCSVADSPCQLRRAASIKPGSAQIKLNTRANTKTPRVWAGEALFECSTNTSAEGTVVLIGGAPAVGWTLGFKQIEWVDTNWLYYRGQHATDGSIFFQRSRPPVRPVKLCRDVDPPTDIFYTDAIDLATVKTTDSFPLTLKVGHSDQPEDSGPAVVVNSKTGKDNFLQEAQLEFLFCTVLTAKDPANNYHHLKHFYWNVRWQAQFRPASFSAPTGPWHVTPIVGGTGQAMSGVSDGAPSDSKFVRALTDPTVPACNALVPLYTNMLPGNPCRHESTTWTNFDVHKK